MWGTIQAIATAIGASAGAVRDWFARTLRVGDQAVGAALQENAQLRAENAQLRKDADLAAKPMTDQQVDDEARDLAARR